MVGNSNLCRDQISNSDFPAESAARLPSIVGVCVRIQSMADGDDGGGNGNGNGNGDSDRVGDSDPSS